MFVDEYRSKSSCKHCLAVKGCVVIPPPTAPKGQKYRLRLALQIQNRHLYLSKQQACS